MKKLLLVSALAALTVSANAAPTVYGRVALDARYAEDGDLTLDNNGTRLGVKGSAALTSTLDAIYQLEWKADLDNDGTSNFKSRDTYLGVQGDTFGTLKAGHLTAIDDAINYTNPSDYWNSGVLGFDGGRAKNALAYVTPNYGGLSFMGMYKATDSDEGSEAVDGDNAGSYGVGAAYEQGPVKAGVTYLSLSDTDADVLRVSGAYDLTSQFTVSGLYQIADYDTDDEENSYIVAAEYDVANSPWAAYVEYDGVTNQGGKEDADMNVISLGGTYQFAKGLSGRVYAGVEDVDGGDDTYGLGTGLTYKF